MLVHDQRLFTLGYRIFRDNNFLDIRLRWNLVHHLKHDRFKDSSKSTGASLPLDRLFSDGQKSSLGEPQLHVLHLEEFLVLLGKRVLRLDKDLDKRALIEVIQHSDHRKTSDKLWNKSELEKVLRLYLREQGSCLFLFRYLLRFNVSAESEFLLSNAATDDIFKPYERPSHDEEDVARINLEEFLLRVLTATLWRNARDGSLKHLKESLLHTLTRHITGYGWILSFARNFIDLVDIHNSALSLLNIVVSVLEKIKDDILNVLSDVTSLCEGCRVRDRKRNLEDSGERLSQERLTGTSWSDQEDV